MLNVDQTPLSKTTSLNMCCQGLKLTTIWVENYNVHKDFHGSSADSEFFPGERGWGQRNKCGCKGEANVTNFTRGI